VRADQLNKRAHYQLFRKIFKLLKPKLSISFLPNSFARQSRIHSVTPAAPPLYRADATSATRLRRPIRQNFLPAAQNGICRKNDTQLACTTVGYRI